MQSITSRSTFQHLRIAISAPDSAGHAAPTSLNTIAFVLSLENRSTVPAQMPFLCLMDLGFNLETHRNWNSEKISSDGRRLVRFSYRPVSALMPFEGLPVCNFVLRLSTANAVHVAVGTSAPVALDAMKSVRLFAIAGAANFPAERGYIEIPAADIRAEVLKRTGTQQKSRVTA